MIHRNEISNHPLALLRLRGSQVEMGEQFGRLVLELGGWKPMLDFYPRMPGYLLTSGVPLELRRPLAFLLQHAMTAPASAMNHYRQRRFPEYYARTVAMAKVAGVPVRLTRHLMVMDAFQNVVGLVGRWGLFPATQLAAATGSGCTSLAVWNDSTADGRLLHARNFDFPGAGLWDEAPTVVFCDATDGLRYGYVSTRGVDLPGVTAFNEAGLTLSAHTRFHRDVSFYGASIIDVGHDIIRRAETLKDAIRVAREHPFASTYGLLISSARERSAVLLETTARATEVVPAPPSGSHLACTNRYLSPVLQRGEVTAASVFTADSDARYARAEETAARGRRRGGLHPAELQELLGSLLDGGAAPGDQAAERMSGCCVASPVSVTSVVCDPERQRIQVSVGKSPTGWGPYITVDWDWEGPVEGRVLSDAGAQMPPNHPPAHVRAAYRRYATLCREHLSCAPPRQLRSDIQQLARDQHKEPHFQFLSAVTHMQQGRLADARAALENGLARERGSFRRAQYLLWLSRVHDAVGERGEAERCRGELAELSHPQIAEYQHLSAQERKRPYSRRRLGRVAINMMMIDAE